LLKKTLSCFAVLILALPCLPVNAAFVKSYFAYVYETPKFQTDSLLKLTRGEPVEELEKSGNWIKIKAKDQVGWIHRMSISNQSYSSKITAPKKAIVKKPKRRRNPRLRSARAAVGVKGLRESQVNKIKESETDYKAVEEMETFVINEETAARFLAEYQE